MQRLMSLDPLNYLGQLFGPSHMLDPTEDPYCQE